MFGPKGNPQANILIAVIHFLQEQLVVPLHFLVVNGINYLSHLMLKFG